VASIGLIVGSGVLDWELGWQELDLRETEFGHPSAAAARAEFGDHTLFALPRHGVPHRYAPHAVNYRANLKLLEDYGVSSIIALNTVGGIGRSAGTGALVLPDQIIDYSWGRVQSFSPENDVRHIDFSEPYDQRLRTGLLTAAAASGIGLHEGGVMGVTQGPRLETAAEIGRMARDGCAIVGMTGMPEAVLARELGIPFVALAMVVNPAAGLSDEVIDLNDIRATSARCMAKVADLLRVFFELFEGLD